MKIILTLRRCPGGHGHSSYQPSRRLGAQTQSQRPSTACTETCFTGQRQPPHPRASRWQDGLGLRGPGPGTPGLGDPLSVPVSHIGCSPPQPHLSFLGLSSCLLLPVARMDYLEAPGRGLLVVVKGSKPGALGTATDDQRVLNRALLRLLLVFRFQFLTLGLRVAVRGGSVENRTCSY